MRNLPVDLSGFELRLTADPEIKLKNAETGEMAVDFATKEPLYTVMAFMKALPREDNGYRPKGEEIKVTVKAVEDGLEDGMIVALVGVTVSTYGMAGFGNSVNHGFTYKAEKVIPAKRRAKVNGTKVPAPA